MFSRSSKRRSRQRVCRHGRTHGFRPSRRRLRSTRGCASPRKRASFCAQRTTRARERSGGSGSRAPAPRSRRPRVVERPSSLGQRHLKANRNAVRITRAGCHPAAGTRFHGPPGSSITLCGPGLPSCPIRGNAQEGGVTRLLMLDVDVADVSTTVDRSIDTHR